jgi:hypothetical protein
MASKTASALILAVRQIRPTLDRLADSMWDFTESFHKPVDVGDEDAPQPYCLKCKADWPCDESVRLHKRRHEMTRRD